MAACVNQSAWFYLFEKLRLTINQRVARAEVEFRALLKRIGTGVDGESVVLPEEAYVANKSALMKFCFPDEYLRDPLRCMSFDL